MAVKFTAIKFQSLLEYPFIFQELKQTHKNKSVFVCIGRYIIAYDDYLTERIIYFLQRGQLLFTFGFM